MNFHMLEVVINRLKGSGLMYNTPPPISSFFIVIDDLLLYMDTVPGTVFMILIL